MHANPRRTSIRLRAALALWDAEGHVLPWDERASVMTAPVYAVLASANPQSSGFWENSVVAAALIGLMGVLIGTGFGFWQWRRSYRTKREFDRSSLDWERQRVVLEDRLARDRIAWEQQELVAARRAAAEETMEARLRTQAERASAMEKQAVVYRQALIAELRNLKILDMTKPLDLDELYVQLQVREEESPRYLKDEDVATLARGDPEKLLRLSQVRLGERAALALTPEDALRRFNKIVVIGDPGAGKTTMLRHLAFRSAREDFVPSLVLPVYVELRRFIDSGHDDLLDFAADQWHERYGFVGALSYLEQELASGRAVLLLDGLDEVLGGDTAEAANRSYNRAASEINRLATRFPNAPIAVTCRRGGWRSALPAFQTLEVLDFNWDQIQTFLNNWFSDSPTKAEELRRVLAGNLRMQTFAANPLLLSLIAIVYERELELPERREQLYRRCVDVLLKEWDSHREILRFGKFTTDRKRDLLEEIAWHFHRRGLRYYPKSELLDLIASFLPTIALPPEDAAEILDEIAAHYGLLKVQAHDLYGFLHLTLQEYFVAVAANERSPQSLDEVAHRCHDPWWEEVIILLAGRMSDATPLLLKIVGRESREPPDEGKALAANDDLFHSDLYLAGDCLVGTPRIREPWLRDRIIADIRQIFQNSPYPLDHEQAATVLTHMNGGGIASELLGMLRNRKVSFDRKKAIVDAYGRSGDISIAPHLLELLKKSLENDNSLVSSITLDNDDSLVISIAEALGQLRYKPALSTLLLMLDRFVEGLPDDVRAIEFETGLDRGTRIATALGALQDPVAIERIVSVLIKFSNVHDDLVCQHLLAACLEALESIGDNAPVGELLELLKRVRWASSGPDLIKAIANLAEGNASRHLLTALLADTTYGPLKPAIARTLRDLKQAGIVPAALAALKDPAQKWEIRWLLAEALEGSREACEATLALMLQQSDLDERVRVGIAATLGTWKEALGLPYLRAAIENDLIPGDLVFDVGSGRTYTYRSYFWHRIARVLRSFDDEWIVPSFVAKLDSALSHASPRKDLPPGVWTVLSALADDPPEAIGLRILNLIERGFGSMYESAWDALTIVLSKPLIPKIMARLENNLLIPRTRDDMDSLLTAIGETADDDETAKRLLRMLLRAEQQDSLLAPILRDALYKVCRKSRVRVYSDGRTIGSIGESSVSD